MMMMIGSIRRFSTRRIVDKLFNVFQSSKDERQTKLGDFLDNYIQQGKNIDSNLLSDVIQRWAIEQPTRDALWTYASNNNECQKLTFNDVHTQSSRFANVLTGKEFDLTPGKTVLVVLPDFNHERILLQIACLQRGLIFCPYDPKDLTDTGISQRIQKLAVDCIITNEDNLEIVRKYTHSPLRPLKKGLITKCSTSEPLPVGWNHLIQIANDAENKDTKVTNTHPDMPAIRLLSNDNDVIQYSQESLNHCLILTALCFNIERTSCLIWMKNPDKISLIAPWLSGSSIFHQETENLFDTFKNHPIDTFCGSAVNYQIVDNQQQENKTQLKQLLSTEPIDRVVKARWYSLTNLHIRDNCVNLNNKSILNSFSNYAQQTKRRTDILNWIHLLK